MDRLTEADTTYAFLSGLRAVKYGYDYASNRNSMTDPQTVQTTYGYDALNRLNGLTYNGQTPGNPGTDGTFAAFVEARQRR